MRRDPNYTIFYVCWFWAVITGTNFELVSDFSPIFSSSQGLIPFLILAVLSFKIYRSMKKLRERLNQGNKLVPQLLEMTGEKY